MTLLQWAVKSIKSAMSVRWVGSLKQMCLNCNCNGDDAMVLLYASEVLMAVRCVNAIGSMGKILVAVALAMVKCLVCDAEELVGVALLYCSGAWLTC